MKTIAVNGWVPEECGGVFLSGRKKEKRREEERRGVTRIKEKRREEKRREEENMWESSGHPAGKSHPEKTQSTIPRAQPSSEEGSKPGVGRASQGTAL
jgi:hypothetical protein